MGLRDTCGTLHENWYAACTSAELGTKKPLGRTILEEMLVVYRDMAGQPVALIDRCLHRNALLSEGDVFAGCIGCPYHGWTYNSQGQCVHIPSEGPERAIRPDKTLQSFPCMERDGLVWVYMGDPDNIRNEPFRMPFYKEKGWRSYYMITTFANGVTNLVENFMDVPHTVFVHSKWFRNQTRTEGEALVTRTATSVEIEYFHQDSIGFTERALNPKGLPMTHTDKFFMPNVTRVDYTYGDARNFVISSQITPVNQWESQVYTAIAFRFGWLNAIAEPFMRWYTRVVIEQDVRIMAIQSKALKRYGPQFMSTEADLVHEWIESLRDYAECGEQGDAPVPAAKRIRFWI
ncbi:MAG: aromatic ring-hydroxylating dioxygenase subunit alpha [Candidatus Sericytochromatia bacterium]|nr:aromatic ring-hydroxylating dioxygenase subunit alpha [Candidatus Sericytochromatia bacterium]